MAIIALLQQQPVHKGLTLYNWETSFHRLKRRLANAKMNIITITVHHVLSRHELYHNYSNSERYVTVTIAFHTEKPMHI